MHCCSKAASGLPFFGGMSLVWESGSCGLTVVLPVVVPGAVVVDAVVEAVGTGEVTDGMETGCVVVSPELSLPHPAAISPVASANGMTVRYRRLTTRRGPAGAARSTGSR